MHDDWGTPSISARADRVRARLAFKRDGGIVDAFQALLIGGFRSFLKWDHPPSSFLSRRFPPDHLRVTLIVSA